MAISAKRLVASLVVTLGVAVSVSPEVSAQTRTRGDATGEMPAAIDVTSVRASYGQSSMSAKIKVRDLGEKGRFVFGGYGATYDGMDVAIWRHRGKTRWAVYHSGERENPPQVACPRATATWRKRRSIIRVNVPLDCYPGEASARWRFFVNAYKGNHSEYASIGRLRRG